MKMYSDKDMMTVFIDGVEQQVPKAWKGTDLLNAPNVSYEAADGDDVSVPEGEPNDSWTNKQLDAYAAAKEIDLGGAGNKAAKLAAIDKAKVL